MLTQIRRIQKGTLIVVTILIVIAFAFLYSDFDFVQGTVGRQDCVVKVYDRCYRQKEAQQLANNYEVALQLGLHEFAFVLFGENRQDQDRTDFIMSLVILRKEAERLGINPSTEEIKKAIPNLPVFQQPWVTADYIQNNILGPNGFTDGDLAQLVKDYLSFQKLRDLMGAGIGAIPAETARRYIQRNQRYEASVIRFDRGDFSEGIEITDAEIEEYYEANKPAEGAVPAPEEAQNLMSDQKRGFDYVKFVPKTLPEDATNEQKAKANLEFANAVNRAYSDLADEDADFIEVAKQYEGQKAEFTLETGKFDPFAMVEAPEAIQGNNEMLEAMFSGALPMDEVTVPLQTEDGGYYVFHYSEVEEPRPLTLEEAKPAIRKALKAKKSNQAVSDAANEALAKVTEAVGAGKSFAEAAKSIGKEAEKLPNFSETEPPANVPDASLVLEAVEGLGEGEVSPVVERPGGAGYLIAYVDAIEIYEDEGEDSKKKSLSASTETRLDGTMFRAWFNQRRAESQSARAMSTAPMEEE